MRVVAVWSVLLFVAIHDTVAQETPAVTPAAQTEDWAKPNSDPEIHLKSARIYANLEKWELARDGFQAALDAGNRSDEVWAGLGQTIAKLGDLPKAISILEEGLEEHGDSIPLRLTLAEAYLDSRRGEDAIRILERAQELAPGDVNVLRLLSAALRSRGKAYQAMVLLEEDRALEPEDVPDLQKAASEYLEIDKFDWAVETLNQALQLDEKNGETHALLARAYQASGNLELAKRSQEKASQYGFVPPAPAGSTSPQDSPETAPSVTSQPEIPPLLTKANDAILEFSEQLPFEPIQDVLEQLGIPNVPPLAVLATIFFVFLILLRLAARQANGDLVVAIDYPQGRKGVFTVRITKGIQKQEIRKHSKGEKATPTTKTSTRFEHYMVSRETQFEKIPAQNFYVSVDGYCTDKDSGKIIEEHFDQKQIQIEPKTTSRVEFNFQPDDCSIEVLVNWDGAPAERAMVGVRERPDTIRYTRNGSQKFFLPKGSFKIIAGSRDRVIEREISIENFDPIKITIEMESDQATFTACPAAVEPYLQGDFVATSKALLAANAGSELGNLLAAKHLEKIGRQEEAAKHYELGGRFLEAAQLQSELGNSIRSAELFERAGDLSRAAAMYRDSGEITKAGWAYETCQEYDAAIECYLEAGATQKVMETYEKCGQYFEAARMADELSDWSRAIRNLQQVTANENTYPEACRLMARAYQAQGNEELALQKIEESISFTGRDETPIHVFEWYSQLLDKAGKFEKAMNALKEIQKRDHNHPHVSTLIDELKKKITAHHAKATTAGRISGLMEQAPTAFSNEDRYEILEEIGRGGMGIVFKAHDHRLNRTIAIKKLPENLKDHPKAVELFLREARSAAALNHSNIVTIYDVDHDNENYFITMEYMEGKPVSEILQHNGRFTAKDVCRLALQTVAGLHYAHQNRIVHRDIKTANLFLTRANIVKIMDFGLAKMIEEVRRSTTVVGGTPYYMSPEQAIGENVDHRADLYSLGVTLYELITGRLPFTEGDVTYHHRHTPPPDPREKVADIPASMADLILELLAKNPDRRCRSAAEVSQRITAIKQSL